MPNLKSEKEEEGGNSEIREGGTPWTEAATIGHDTIYATQKMEGN